MNKSSFIILMLVLFSSARAKELNELEAVVEADTYHIIVRSESQANSIYQDLRRYTGSELYSRFASAAKKYSFDGGSLNNGGHLGYLLQGSMVSEFDERIFSSKENKIITPFKSRFGWHVAMVRGFRTSPVAKICQESTRRAAQNSSKSQKKIMEEIALPLTDVPLQKIKEIIGNDWEGPAQGVDGEVQFFSYENVNIDGVSYVEQHIELPYAILRPAEKLAECERSQRVVWAIKCQEKEIGLAKLIGYPNRAALGMPARESEYALGEIEFHSVYEGSSVLEIYARACHI